MRKRVVLAMHDVDCVLKIGCRRAGELDLAIIDRSDRHGGHLAERSKSVAAICRAHEHVQSSTPQMRKPIAHTDVTMSKETPAATDPTIFAVQSTEIAKNSI